jgi:transketolase
MDERQAAAPSGGENIEQLAITTIRTLAMDAVQAANSGHPGTPMALAPVAYLLFDELLRYDPARPLWPGRDRFVLSCGHASLLLYSMLHLAGVRQFGEDGQPTGEEAVSLDDIRKFRQLGSRCPGHPEHGHTSGVETTTGPLGQGVGNSVGMAIAAQWLASRYNRPGFDLFGFRVFAVCSDGDLMEGISGEAASLAGHLKLSNLCWIYDDNGITIEGHTSLAFSEDVAQRFAGYGWDVLRVGDANDLGALRSALAGFPRPDRPLLVIVRSHIAYGAPHLQDTAEAHGAPLGAEEVRLTKRAYGWPEEPPFLVPEQVPQHFRQSIGRRGRDLADAWYARYAEYRKQHPELAAQLELMWSGKLPEGWDAAVQPFPADAKGMATRVSSGKVLNQVAKNLPWLLGGAADLAPSTRTELSGDLAGNFEAGHYGARNFHFGIREHAMGAAANGMALCGLRPYASTFFVFSDYMRPSIRLAAIMRLPVLYVFTHDSIGVGEDGPTHQPVEHLAALRAIPGLAVFRPADANEVAGAYRAALELVRQPAALVLTRQNVPTFDRSRCASAEGVRRGAYVLVDPPAGAPQVILMATGSEVALCVEAAARLAGEGVPARVVSMPCWELFDAQPAEYRQTVLPPQVTARLAVEMAVQQGWERYLGPRGRFLGMHGYGLSAPSSALAKHFGFTVDKVVVEAKAALRDS